MSSVEYILIGAAFLGGLVDSIAGGGGMVTIPAMLLAGLPPHLALGTNKLQAFVGSFTASYNYWRRGLFSMGELKWGIVATAIGAISGTLVVQVVSADFLNTVIPILLISIFIYMLFSPNLGKVARHALMNKFIFYFSAGLILGFYDGFFGPGTGSFWAISMVMLLGINLRKATAHTKMMNFISNITALIVFIIGGKVAFKIGIMMWPGQILGAWLGSKLVIKHDVKFIRYVLLFVTGATILVMILK